MSSFAAVGATLGPVLPPATAVFYRQAMRALNRERVPFLVGGAYALERYTGIARHTKDFDVFLRPRDVRRALAVLDSVGCQTDLTYTHWLAKAFRGGDFIDVIFSSGNGVAAVDDGWFAHAVSGQVLGVGVKLCPAEETIWSKAFIMERERYDGADIAHLLRARAARLDWPRLLDRFGDFWPVLLSHVLLFRFIYPGERDRVPAWVVHELLRRVDAELDRPSDVDGLCRGTILSRAQYLIDIHRWGYRDPRLAPEGNMTDREVAHWTAAIDDATT